MADVQVVVLAAGQGTRMRSRTPKVLHQLGGKPLILHVLDAAAGLSATAPVVVVAPGQPEVAELLSGRATVVEQAEPRGTGDAVRSVPHDLRSAGAVAVLSADVPLLRGATLEHLLHQHEERRAACTLLTFTPADPHGLGRVIRDEAGHVLRIVEDADLTGDVPATAECNAGVYVFDGTRLWEALDRLAPDNAQGEHYLTDLVAMLAPDVEAMQLEDSDEALGVNDRIQLAQAEGILRRRTLEALMAAGVTIEDPATTYVDATVRIDADCVLLPQTHLRGSTAIGRGSRLGPSAFLRDVEAGEEVVVGASHLEECRLGDRVEIGPYCRVRPGSVLGSGVQLGTHAEIKNSKLGAATRVNHFSCVLDSDVGDRVNVGAGTVTCNFDGQAKHRITIEDSVFIGSNSTLVAPLRLGEGCYIAAGSVITRDVPAGALAVGRGRQRNIEGWMARRTAGRP